MLCSFYLTYLPQVYRFHLPMSTFYPRSSRSPSGGVSGRYFGGGHRDHQPVWANGDTPQREGSAGLYGDYSPQPLTPSSVHARAESGSNGVTHMTHAGESPPPREPFANTTIPREAPAAAVAIDTPTTRGQQDTPAVVHSHVENVVPIKYSSQSINSSSSAPRRDGSGLTLSPSIATQPPTTTSVNTTKHYWELRRAEALVQEVSRRNDQLSRQRQEVEDLKRRARSKLQAMTDLTEARRREAICATEVYRAQEDTRHLLMGMGVKAAPTPSPIPSGWWSRRGSLPVPAYWESADNLFLFVQANPHLLLPTTRPHHDGDVGDSDQSSTSSRSEVTAPHGHAIGSHYSDKHQVLSRFDRQQERVSHALRRQPLMPPAPSHSPSPTPVDVRSGDDYGGDREDGAPYTLREYAHLSSRNASQQISGTPHQDPNQDLHDRYSALLQQATQLQRPRTQQQPHHSSHASLGPPRRMKM
jgi:ElaB/YqjD/DUF883 family membrane-anchored ribosome-binding protein